MGLFSKNKDGGMMNVIRCDEPEYLVWKWRPAGQALGESKRENAIRFGSSLRVKDGEVAVFVYKQKDGTNQDFIEGPYDDTIKTANFPILSSIVGLGFGGDTPFQAEVYFINLQGNNQIKFAVPYFDVFDPRLPDHAVPMSIRGSLTFNVTDYKGFIKLHRLVNFDLESFRKEIKDALAKYIKSVVINIPTDYNIPVIQMERKILEINDVVSNYVKPRLEENHGVNVRAVDISSLEIDKESPYYAELKYLTADQTKKITTAQTDVSVKNLHDMQSINAKNMEETLRIQREEAQRAQKLQTEQTFLGAHAINQQTNVLQTAASNLGQMSQMGGGSGGGMNPAGMMTGMMMGAAVGNQMSGMMNNMGNQMNNSMQAPPPPAASQYMVAVNGQTTGPYTIGQLQQLAASGQFTPQSYVWKNGMAGWEPAGNVAELQSIFMPQTPPPGAMPGGMPTPPPM